MSKRIAAWASVLFLALAISAKASTENSGWVILYYGAGDHDLSYWMETDVNELTDVGSGYEASNGHYFTALALLDQVGAADTKYYWLFLRNYDWDDQPDSHNGRVDMDNVLYYDDGTGTGLDVYLDEVFLDLNSDGKYYKADDACVWPGLDGVVDCPDGTDFEDAGLVEDMNELLGTDTGGGDYDITELDMGNPQTLSAFFQNSKNKFQDYWKYCVLSQGNHGQAQFGSWDSQGTFPGNATNHVLHAIEEDTLVHESSIYQLHVIHYDQCLRSSMDPIYEIADVNENGCPFYVVASELVVALPGLDYVSVASYLRGNPDKDPEDIAIQMVTEGEDSGSYYTCAAYAVNRVSNYGTGYDVKDAADTIDDMAVELIAVKSQVAHYIRGALDDAYDARLWDPNDAFYCMDLKDFVDKLRIRLDPEYDNYSDLCDTLDNVSNDLYPGTTNFCLDYYKNTYGDLKGLSTFMPLYSMQYWQSPGQDPKNDEDPPPNPGYWCWVYPHWNNGTPPLYQPLYYYKSTPGIGQTVYQLADYPQDAPNWYSFLRPTDLTPLHPSGSFTPGSGSTGVSIATDIYCTFLEEIDTNYGTVTVRKVSTGQPVSGALTRYNVPVGGINYGQFKFDPTYSLQTYTQYEVIVGADFRDAAGLYLDGNNDQYGSQTPADQVVWRFTTGGC